MRSLLALKLLGNERKSHVMDLVFDQAIALFAGLNCVPKRSYLAAYSSRVDHRANLRLMDAWFERARARRLAHGDSLDLDFHTVPANTTAEPLEKHYVSWRSRRQQGILVFLARDAEQRVLRYAQAGIPKAEQADEILRFVEFWKTPHRQAAGRTDLRLAAHHPRQSVAAEPAGHPLHHPAPPLAQDAGGDLQPRRPRPGSASRSIR